MQRGISCIIKVLLVVLICMHSMILNIFGIHDTDQHKDRHIIVFRAILLLNLAYLFYTEFHLNTIILFMNLDNVFSMTVCHSEQHC